VRCSLKKSNHMTRAPYSRPFSGSGASKAESWQGAVRFFGGGPLCPPPQTGSSRPSPSSPAPTHGHQLHPSFILPSSLIPAQPLAPIRPLQTPTSPAHGVWPPPATGWCRGSLPDMQMIVFHQQRSSFLSYPPLHSSRTHARKLRTSKPRKALVTRDTPLLSHCMCFLH
jgi:hypothetical protein